ncbi:VOC family protein [Nannocystis sp. SCPEA4]|uniref:VOC family protein n=1 Tax=Nannocystis sp. SCPEA4 TaxID=2996787 RepID=UPI002271EEBC|nr:VOC family protein [Nannocystis sp. SCPEA4]MCY1057629.1 VOC family protein [Nannocystis sp. SCPEA4]
MTDRPETIDGAPCWADLITSDREGAQRFYGGLFDWSFDAPNPRFGGYANVRLRGQSVGGVMPIVPGLDMRVGWNVHLQSSDLEATARRVAAAGGKVVLERHPVGTLGFMMGVVDPTGAYVGMWQPGEHRGAEWIGAPGGMCWHELYTRDGARADAFFRAVFDYEQTKVENDKGVDYARYGRAGRPLCGRLQMTAAWGEVPPHWLVHFAVSELAAALAKLPSLGGRLIHGPFETPMGPSAMVADPQGAVFALTQVTGSYA